MTRISVGDMSLDPSDRLKSLTKELAEAITNESNLKKQLLEVGKVIERTMSRINEVREVK